MVASNGTQLSSLQQKEKSNYLTYIAIYNLVSRDISQNQNSAQPQKQLEQGTQCCQDSLSLSLYWVCVSWCISSLFSSTDHFLHSKSTWKKMVTNNIYTVQVRSQIGLKSLESKAQVSTLIVQAWVTYPLFDQLIIAR